MAKTCSLFAVVFILATVLLAVPANDSAQDWTNFVRIGAYGLKGNDAEKIVRDATDSKVSGIEVDNDIPGRYESFVDPTEKLKAIRAVAEAAHKAGNHAFVYIAGTECITAHGDKTSHTLAKEHPDWLQRKITGEPAIFGGGSAFWISPGDEDVWISFYAADWRKIYMERVKQIAATGIDGIYVDIPYWMTHFDGWEDSWASFDDATVAAFRKQTGLDARHDLKLGDFSDENFRKWVDFRIQTVTDFMAEIDRSAKSVNPQIKTIPEIYPGIEQESVRVGADVYSLYPVVDAIAHEYEFGGGDHMASSRTPLDWFEYQVGMHSFRAFAQGKATWILNYSWDGDKKVDMREAMKNLAMSHVMAGANFWDAPGHSMGGSNDLAMRKKIFTWIADHEATFYHPRKPSNPVGVYFSPKTRDYYPQDFIASYRGCLMLLMQKHWEFQVVTPRTLDDFQGDALLLPDVRVLSDAERASLKKLAASGKRIVITGQVPLELGDSANIVLLNDSPGTKYVESLDANLEKADPSRAAEFFAAMRHAPQVEIEAAPQIATSIAMVDGKRDIFLANFNGLRGGENPVATPQKGITIRAQAHRATYLPFMGTEQPLEGKQDGEWTTFTLPVLERGGVVRLD